MVVCLTTVPPQMSTPPRRAPPLGVPAAPTRAVSRVDGWAVGPSNAADFAVQRVCRHQLGDLSKDTADADGCLICPWHQARYDVTDGRVVSGPRGFLGYHGPTPGYSQLVRAYARVPRLRVGWVRRTVTVWTVQCVAVVRLPCRACLGLRRPTVSPRRVTLAVGAHCIRRGFRSRGP